jgi:predicted  nucleic acid-binding Zn-ribbon protein
MSGEAPEAEPFAVLLRVQDFDTSIAQIRHRRATITERVQLQEVERAMADLQARLQATQTQRAALAERQGAIEAQLTTMAERRRRIEERLYGSRDAAARDLQAMQEEVDHLRSRAGELEDDELAIMEEQEPLEAEAERLAAQEAELESAAGALRTAVTAAENVLDTEIATLERAREAEARALPPELASRYDTLRSRLGGTGAARLVGNRCDGCHLELPSAEVDRIRHLPPDAVVTCEQCGRILVRSSPPAAHGD